MDVFLDIGFTLMGGPSLSPPKMIRKILALDESHSDLLSNVVFSEHHRNPDDLIASLAHHLNLYIEQPQKAKIHAFWQAQFQDVYPLQGAVELLNWLGEQGVGVHLASNLWVPFYQKFRSVFARQLPWIRSETLSFREGIKKPSPHFYQRALTNAGADPQAAVMVGDSVGKDILPCADLGFHCIWFRSRPLSPEALAIRHRRLEGLKKLYEAERLQDVPLLIERIQHDENS